MHESDIEELQELQSINATLTLDNEGHVLEIEEEITRLKKKLVSHLCIRRHLKNTAEETAALEAEITAALEAEAPAPLEEEVAAPLEEEVAAPLEEEVAAPLEEDSCAPSTAQELCDHDFVYCCQGGSRVPYSEEGFVCPDCGLLCDLEDCYLCGEVCEGCGVKPHWDLYDARDALQKQEEEAPAALEEEAPAPPEEPFVSNDEVTSIFWVLPKSKVKHSDPDCRHLKKNGKPVSSNDQRPLCSRCKSDGN